MTSLFVDRRDVHLQLDGGALVFRENGQRIGAVPLAPITRVFLRGNVTLEASLLGKLGEGGAGVVILSGKQARPSLMLSRPHNDARRRVAQVRLSLDNTFCLAFSRQLIQTKIERQCEWFEQLRHHYLHARYELSHAISLLQESLQKKPYISCRINRQITQQHKDKTMTKHNAYDETLPASFLQELKQLMEKRPLHEEPAESHRKNRNLWALGNNDPVTNYPPGLPGPQQFIHQKEENRKFFAKTEKYSESYFERCFWIINTWGGISAFKDSDKTREKIQEFAETYMQEEISSDLFAVISSLSKLAAFWDYERFAVYDSRVIFSLNWLLFLYAPAHRLFPQPEGRNQRIRQYHMPTILALHGDERDFYPDKEAFYRYCQLLKECAKQIYGDDKRIHEIEMFLFKEADLYICDDMQKRLSLTIKPEMEGNTP